MSFNPSSNISKKDKMAKRKKFLRSSSDVSKKLSWQNARYF